MFLIRCLLLIFLLQKYFKAKENSIFIFHSSFSLVEKIKLSFHCLVIRMKRIIFFSAFQQVFFPDALTRYTLIHYSGCCSSILYHCLSIGNANVPIFLCNVSCRCALHFFVSSFDIPIYLFFFLCRFYLFVFFSVSHVVQRIYFAGKTSNRDGNSNGGDTTD